MIMKELSIEEKAKAYDEAKARMSRAYNSNRCTICFMNEIFPELQESEDERIRKVLISQYQGDGCIRNNEYRIDYKDIRAWLEKKGVKVSAIEDFDTEFEKQVSYLIASAINKEHEYNQGFVKWIANALLNYAKHELEKQGEQKLVKFKPLFKVGDVIKPKDPVLGEPRIIKGIHPKFGYDTNNGILDFEFEDNWELVEQKPTDKVEPKFKVGEWITDNYSTFQIVRVEDEWYYADDGDKICFDVAHQYYHLWTIQDAKDGDVIFYDDGWTCIFKNIHGIWYSSYCFITADGEFHTGYERHAVDAKLNGNANPATKEQRDLLFQKMKEAGYEFDFETKELKKIEDEV